MSAKQQRSPGPGAGALRLGLCCQFAREPIKFRTTTATAMLRLSRKERLARLAELCRSNAEALLDSLRFCANHGIGAFRINSQILPVKTHPVAGYSVGELPDGAGIVARFRECGTFARNHRLRLSFHPDQFVVLNSPNPKTQAHSLAELAYQAEVAEWTGADTVNIHGGGAYGDKPGALRTLRLSLERLPSPVRARLTLENDDKVYTPADLLPVCADTGVPLVYDVHHHRCLPDGLSVAEATERARRTWPSEPLFHLSSPLEGWDGPNPERHDDYINVADFPAEWLGWPLTVEVEAKAKELAVARLLADLGGRWGRIAGAAALLILLVFGAVKFERPAPPVRVAETPAPRPAHAAHSPPAGNTLLAYRLALSRSPETFEALLSQEVARPAFSPQLALRVGQLGLDLEF